MQLSKKMGYILTGEMPCVQWERRCVDDEERAAYEKIKAEYPDMVDPEYRPCQEICLEREPVPDGWNTLARSDTPLLTALAKKGERQ